MNTGSQTPSSISQSEEGVFSTSALVHPTAIIGPDVQLAAGVEIGPYCIITGKTTIGSGTHLTAHVTVGYPAQNIGTTESLGTITIGSNCTIREFVSIHASKKDGGETRIGNNCYIMTYCHVAHDVTLEDNVLLVSNTSLGGHTYLERNVVMMAHAGTHQFCRVGKYTAVAPYSGSRQDLPPFCLFEGQPGRFAGLNRVALKRAGIDSASIENLRVITRQFFQRKKPLDELKALVEEKQWSDDQLVNDFITFIEKSSRGISRKTIIDSERS